MFRAPRHPKTIFSRFLMVLGMSVAHVVGGANIVRAAPLDLEFVPPQIEPTRICVPRPPDAQTVALWGNWDGVRLPAVSAAIVSRDINRLKQLDATRWLPTIEQMIARLEESEPRFAGTNALMARISAMEAAGEFEALNSQQLVAQLAADIETLSPRLKNEVSQYYRDGIGVPLDIEFANSLLIDAAYGGNADALLSLAKMELDGEGLDAWDVPTDLAVTMAFGALVGELDPYICDRATRIAREYISGEIVVQNAQLSHDWFRFAADLGDSNSAWKVVEFHSQAEAFEKDNDLLVRYLTQAADAQISYAQIELARLYEAGSLVDRNLDTALSLYRAAATSGLRPGLTRIMIFLEEHAERYPNLQEERLAALQQLSELDDVSGWVFTRLAEESYLRQGRWAGRADAMAYLERAAELDDLDGSVELAMGLIAQRNSPETFERAVDILSRSVTTLGGVRPTRLLYGAFMCSALDSPRLQEAQYWNATEDATATLNVEISASRLYDLSAQTDPLLIARLQSQALYGRSRSMANYLKYLEVNPAIPPETLAFWQEYSNQFSDVLTATAKLELELAQSPQQRVLAIDLLRQEYVSSGGSAALLLAEALLNFKTDVDFKREEVRNLLITSASLGQGKALSLLTTLEGGNNGAEEIYLQFADVIEANGDFDAILFAIPYVDAEVRENYLSRAAGIISCDYKNVITLSRLLNDINDKNGALLVTGKDKDGKIKYHNLNYLHPDSDMLNAVTPIILKSFRGEDVSKDLDEALMESAYGLVQPYVSPSLAVDFAKDMLGYAQTGEDYYIKNAYKIIEPGYASIIRDFAHQTGNLNTSIDEVLYPDRFGVPTEKAKGAADLINKTTGGIPGITGGVPFVKQKTFDPKLGLAFALKEISSNVSKEDRDFTSDLKSTILNENRSSPDNVLDSELSILEQYSELLQVKHEEQRALYKVVNNLKGVMNDYQIRRFLKHQGKAAKSGLSNKVISSAMNGRSYSKGKGTSNAFWGDISETLYQRTGNRDSKRLNNLRNLMRQMEGMYDNINLLEDAPEVSLSVQE